MCVMYIRATQTFIYRLLHTRVHRASSFWKLADRPILMLFAFSFDFALITSFLSLSKHIQLFHDQTNEFVAKSLSSCLFFSSPFVLFSLTAVMHRFFGTKKEKAPAPTLGDASKSIDTRGAAIDAKIAALEKQILPLKQKLKTMRNGPSKKSVQRRAVMLLRQQKGYEKQRDTLYCQQANLDQTTFAMENLQDTKTMV